MARSAILLGDEIDKLTPLGLPLWQRGRGDFKIDFLESLESVMPDLIRHPELFEFNGFRLAPE